MNSERRKFLKSTDSVCFATLAGAVGLFKHSVVFSADSNKSLFEKKDLKAVLFDIVRRNGMPIMPNRKISLEFPEISENSSAIPVQVTSNIENTTRILLICEQLDFPLIADFMFSNGALGFVSTRFKLRPMCGFISVRAIVHTADGRIYTNVREGYVTQGDCPE